MAIPVAEINLDALRHNLGVVRKAAPHSKILAMLKANAYGHGLVRTAHALSGADAFAVARLDEAIILRQAGIKTPIVVMMGFLTLEELELLIEYNVESVIHSDYQIDYLYQTTLKRPLKVWLKIETGLNRLGFLEKDANRAYDRLMACAQVQKPMCIMSHFACAELLDRPKNEQQLAQFLEITRDFEGPKSIAKSASIMALPKTHLDWVRPGAMLYGLSPFPGEIGVDRGLRPTMHVSSKIISIKHLATGEAIGYGETFHAEEDMPTAVVAIGYADGYPRHMPSGTPVLINGVRCPLIGRVSMDMIMIDIRAYPQAKVGDTVTLWGDGLPVEVVARCGNTIAYTLLVGLTQRVQFIETYDERDVFDNSDFQQIAIG